MTDIYAIDAKTDNTAIIVVDVQNDFCEGGALAVDGGSEIAWLIATSLNVFTGSLVVFTKDWHEDHSDNGHHFSEAPDFVDTWPAHCVQDTFGAEFHPSIQRWFAKNPRPVFYKGQGKPAYSGFEGISKDGTDLKSCLLANEINTVVVIGIAADYCVRATALDAIANGFNTYVIPTLTVGISQDGETVAREIAQLQEVSK